MKNQDCSNGSWLSVSHVMHTLFMEHNEYTWSLSHKNYFLYMTVTLITFPIQFDLYISRFKQ